MTEITIPVSEEDHRLNMGSNGSDADVRLRQLRMQCVDQFETDYNELKLIFDMSGLPRDTRISSSYMGIMISIRNKALHYMAEGREPVCEVKNAPQGVIEQFEISALNRIFTVLEAE